MPQTEQMSGPARVFKHPARGDAKLRALHVVLALVLLFFFMQIYENYISLVWGYLGMRYREYRPWEIAFIVSQIAIVAAVLPTHFSRPSAIVVWMMYTFVFIPTMVITPIAGAHESAHYVPVLLLLSVIFVGMGIVSQWSLPRRVEGTGLFRAEIDLLFLGAWGASSLILLFAFRDILSLSSVDDIYFQRALAKGLSGGPINYVQTYYTYVLSPTMLAIGLLKRKWIYVGCGFMGFLITYMIDAQKLSLIVPVVMVAIWLAYRYRQTSLALFTGGLASLVAVCAGLTSHTVMTKLIINVLVFRAIAVPGQMLTQYYDLFSARGYTWWSNIRGISLFVPRPEAFESDRYWPSLGMIVGDEYYGHMVADVNANANAFAGEGVAAGGAIGLLVIGLLMMAWLRVVDVVASRWSLPLVTLVMLPVALCLTNVHLSTVILSFGGGFWILVLLWARPQPLRQHA